MTGRQKELHAREMLFKQTARDLLVREGYQGVTIHRIAELTGFSKNTVYAFFGSKDELIASLGMECRLELLATVRKAAGFPGRPRERIVALGEMMMFYVQYHEEDHRVLKIIDAEAVLNRVPEGQREKMKEYDVGVFEAILGIVESGVAAGDLVLRNGNTAQSMTFAFWTMVDGSLAASMGAAPLDEIGVKCPMFEVVRNGHLLMDGYGWRPLSHEHDYEATACRARDLLLGNYTEKQPGATTAERR